MNDEQLEHRHDKRKPMMQWEIEAKDERNRNVKLDLRRKKCLKQVT